MHYKIPAVLLLFLGTISIACAAPKENTLIIPGESIGAIKLGADATKVGKEKGDPAYSDAGMGKVVESWFLGAKHGDKGRMFHRPDEIGLRAHFNEDASKHVVSQIEVTSPKYMTAEGIAPGSTLDAIRAKFPDIQPDDSSDIKFWPLYGAMQFFKDTKRGIAFAVRKSDSVCIQVCVMPPAGDGFFLWIYPAAAQDYVVDDVNGRVGPAELGATGTKILSLLGKPDEKRDVANGVVWRWRIPPQHGAELPALCIYLQKLPDGSLVAQQIRVSSPAFALTDKIFPGCALKDAMEATPNIKKIDSEDAQHIDIYGDLRAGVLFDVRQHDSICPAITIFTPLLDVHADMSARWLDLPAQPDGGD